MAVADHESEVDETRDVVHTWVTRLDKAVEDLRAEIARMQDEDKRGQGETS